MPYTRQNRQYSFMIPCEIGPIELLMYVFWHYSPQLCGKYTSYSPQIQSILRKFAAISPFILRKLRSGNWDAVLKLLRPLRIGECYFVQFAPINDHVKGIRRRIEIFRNSGISS